MTEQLGGWRPQRAPGTTAEDHDEHTDVTVLNGAKVRLNDTAAAVWRLCDGATSVDEMVSAMQLLFAADAQDVRSAVESVLVELRSQGAIR